jgi:hypothetical protein
MEISTEGAVFIGVVIGLLIIYFKKNDKDE